MYFTLLLIRVICKLGNVTCFGESYKIGENLLLYLENAAKLSHSVTKTIFYEALTFSRTLGFIEPIYFEKKN